MRKAISRRRRRRAPLHRGHLVARLLRGGTRCGVAINSVMLATIVGVLSTLLGLTLALVVQRGGQRFSACSR
jgi:ABC-type Fe3+ transport system permease subunit